MKINWKVRITNPIFWASIGAAVLLPILTYFGLTVEDITSWSMLGKTLLDALSNPFVVGTIVASVAGVVNDPTSDGLSDSETVLNKK